MASAAVEKTTATAEKIIHIFMLVFSWFTAEPGRFRLRTSSIRQLSRKYADQGRVFNKSCHRQRVATLFYKLRNVAAVRRGLQSRPYAGCSRCIASERCLRAFKVQRDFRQQRMEAERRFEIAHD